MSFVYNTCNTCTHAELLSPIIIISLISGSHLSIYRHLIKCDDYHNEIKFLVTLFISSLLPILPLILKTFLICFPSVLFSITGSNYSLHLFKKQYFTFVYLCIEYT